MTVCNFEKKKKQFKNSYLSKYVCSHYETIFNQKIIKLETIKNYSYYS